MKRIAVAISVLGASMFISALPVVAAEEELSNMTGQEAPQAQQGAKDDCLLVALNCPSVPDTVEQRIDKLNREIAKGMDVYTSEELQILNDKLEDAYKEMDKETY
jgi:hypothetical protein